MNPLAITGLKKKSKIFIYLEKSTPRTEYVFELVFKHVFSIDYVTSNSLGELSTTKLPSIQYSKKKSFNKGIHIYPFGLLSKTVPCDKPTIEYTQDEQRIYPTSHGVFSFDVFSAIFYIVSSAEEYNATNDKLDIHGRFKSEYSILKELGVQNIPIINYWLEHLKQLLKKEYPTIDYPGRAYSFQLSCDIDMAWSYKNKGFLRNTGALLKNLFNGKLTTVKNQLQVLSNKSKDPFENYDLLSSLNSKDSILYFILLGQYGTYDKNISPSNKAFRKLIESLNKKNEIGIHPSYGAGYDEAKVNLELSLLKSIIKKDIQRSRQHYLKINWPKTYRLLIEAGIKHEYSLGYYDTIGFRTGMCYPYPWYDLEREEKTDLMLHPFQIMDVSLKNYLKLTPEDAINRAKPIITEVKKYQGDFHLIWHNSSFNGHWDDWTKCLKELIKEARSD